MHKSRYRHFNYSELLHYHMERPPEEVVNIPAD